MAKKVVLWLVKGALQDDEWGQLVSFGKAFTSLEAAAKFVLRDYNGNCKIYDDPDKLPNEKWRAIAKDKCLQSPGNGKWRVRIVWDISRQTIAPND